MTDKELMQQALDALEEMGGGYSQNLIAALRERLAQPEQEPVVWMYQDKSTHEVRFQKHMRGFVDHGATYETPLYTTPQPRQWQGLTVAQIEEAFQQSAGADEDTHIRFARAIEAKLKEKSQKQIATLTAMCETLNKLQETAVGMLKPAIAAAVQKERDELTVMFLEAHEGAKNTHNYWAVAANKIKERNT